MIPVDSNQILSAENPKRKQRTKGLFEKGK